MKKSMLMILPLLVVAMTISAQPKPDYYNSAEGKKKEGLKTTLSGIISKGTRDVGYGGLYEVYQTSDLIGSNNVWDMYSDCIWIHGQKKCGSYGKVCDCYNREHSIPQSWFDERLPMKSDAFHVYPTDGKVNGQRSNHPFGECANGTSLGGKAKGRVGSSTFSGYSGTVFEPDDEYKGDFARTYFYFVTRYESQISGFSGASFANNTYPSLSSWSINLFLKWHREDPVSEKEIVRNNAVEKHQRNRNPFIDYPILAEHIWGLKMNESFYTNPQSLTDTELSFEPVATVRHSLLQISSVPENTVLYLYDVSGALLLNQTLKSNNFEVELPHTGLYILKFAYQRVNKTVKVMAQQD